MDKPTRLSLDRLRGFCAAARNLSFTRAARELFVTQSAVSHEVKILEEQLGQPLFLRVNRALKLTPAGEELYRATSEALGLIDAATDRLSGEGKALTVTTTPAFASTWLAPRLPSFIRSHPDMDVRVAATNETVNLQRENVDVAIRYVPPGWDIPGGTRLLDYEVFPVCAPALAADPARPLRRPADLAHHVRIDFEAVVYGRSWYDWEQWFDGMRIRRFKPAGTLRFLYYDQVVRAAIEGAGVAIGKRPHLVRHLRDGVLCAPLGPDCVVPLGSFDIVVAESSPRRDAVDAFVAWLWREVAADDAGKTPAPRRARRRGRDARSGA